MAGGVPFSKSESIPKWSGSSSAMLFCCFNKADIILATEAEPAVCTRVGPILGCGCCCGTPPGGGEGFGEQWWGEQLPSVLLVVVKVPPVLANEEAEGEREVGCC